MPSVMQAMTSPVLMFTSHVRAHADASAGVVEHHPRALTEGNADSAARARAAHDAERAGLCVANELLVGVRVVRGCWEGQRAVGREVRSARDPNDLVAIFGGAERVRRVVHVDE